MVNLIEQLVDRTLNVNLINFELKHFHVRSVERKLAVEFVKDLLINHEVLNYRKSILIDEFQDTDHYQKDIFEKLFKVSESFTIVGDVDQSIYGWRGAYPEYFESFSGERVKQ